MQTLEEQIRATQQKNIDKIPQNITLEQATRRDDLNSVLNALPSYKDNSLQRFAKGAITGLQSLNDVAPAVEIYGRQVDLAIGGYFGAKPKTIERKALNLSTAYRNLQAAQKERYKYSNPEDTNSLAYGLGQGAVNYGMMLLGSGATASAKVATGLVANALLENVEQQSERMPLNKNNEIDINQITPQWAKNSAIGTTTYLGISTILEKGFGFGKQVKMWETPIKTSNKAIKISSPVVKQAAKNALSEGVTEGLQSLTSTGILLAEGKIDVSQLPDRLKDAWKEAVIGGIIGGTVGTAVGINQAHNVKTMLTEEISKVVTDPEECEKVVEAIYDSGTAEMTNVISRELELSSELNNKHGAIYDTMQGAIYDAINNAGAFEGVPEAEIAQYVSDTSKMFANQVLAEANKRGVLIDEVLKASDIKYENGKIYMQAGKEVVAENTVTEETPKALKGSIEMNVNEQEEETGIEQETKIARYQELQTQLSEIGEQAQAKVLGENYQGKITEEQHKQIDIEADKLGYNKLWKEYSELSKEISAPKMDENGQTKLPQSNVGNQNTNTNNLPKNIDENSLEVVNFTNEEIEKFGKKGSVKEYYNKNIQGTKINHPDSRLGEIYFYGDGANETIDKNYSKNYYILSKIKEIVEKSQYDDVENLKHPRKDGIVKFHILFGKIKTQKNINGRTVEKEQLVRIKIAEDNLGKKFFIVKPAKTYKSSSATEPNTANAFRGDNGTINIIPQSEKNITPETLNQLKNTPKQEKVYRGAYDVSAKAIELFKDADYSTLPHELAHFWLDNMWQFARSGKASDAYMNNFNGVLDWLGVKEGQINLTRSQQEKFARGYEKYLLNGYAPNGLIQGAFDNYDKWLQKVYKDARELKVKLTPDAIEFFDTMTTGELPEYDVPETQAQIREQNIEQMNKDIETARKFVVEKQAEYNNFDGGNVITKDTVPVTTEGEKKQSKAYTNQASILGIAEELNYNKADIAEQNAKATDFVKNNLDEARLVVQGKKEAPSDILKNAIYNAYLKEMLAIGDNEAYIQALKNQSLELTRAGQEIASQRGAIENIFDSAYWIRRIENLKKMRLAESKYGMASSEQALTKMNDFIKNKVDAVMSEFMEADPEQQKKIAEKLSKEIAAEFKAKPDTTLYQTMKEPSELRTRTNAYNYIYRYINGALGLELTSEQYNGIIAKTQAIQKSIETTRNKNGNPSALFFKNVSEMENHANSIEPSPALAILTSTVGRGNMLFSPKTIALNIESNIVNFFTEAITRRLQSGAVNMVVDPQAIKDYLAYSREVFNTSGYQVSSMPSLDPTTQILSEKMTTTGGKGIANSLGRFFEQTIFKYGLGGPDLLFKDLTFVDTANLLATKEAKGDTTKATELFKDICLIEPKTAKGKELREIAINEALVATYQNKSTLSDGALKMREAASKIGNIVLPQSVKLGDLISPFVKTPANVVGLGFDYSMGGLLALRNIKTIYNDIQNGTFSDATRQSIRSLARNGIGFVVASLIAGLIDDDDYIPEYALLSPRERELVKMKGGVFNSVKIGDKYISLDYFGPLAMPLVSILNARKGNDAKSKVWNYFQGSAYQALKLPVIGDLKDLLEGTGRTLTKDVDTNIKTLEDAAIDFISSRSIPAIVTDIAKMTDEYERETNNNALKRLQSKVPYIPVISDLPIIDKIPTRKDLPAQYNYGTGQPRETQNPVSQLFAGARVKEEVSTPVIREIDKLVKNGQQVTLSKITKPPASLATLPDEIKPKVEKEFAKLYAKNVNELIKMPGYKNLDDEEKTNNINGIRSLIVSDLKEKYGLNKKEKKPRTKKLVNKKNINLD